MNDRKGFQVSAQPRNRTDSKNGVFSSLGKMSTQKRVNRRGGGPLGKEDCERHLQHDPTLWSQGLGG